MDDEDHWYKYLNRKGTHNLIENERIDYDTNIIICRQNSLSREFRKFDNYLEFYKYFQEHNIIYQSKTVKLKKTKYHYDSDEVCEDEDEFYNPCRYDIITKMEKILTEEKEYCYYEVLLGNSKRKPYFQLQFFKNTISKRYQKILGEDNKYEKVLQDFFDVLNRLLSNNKRNIFVSISDKYLIFEIVVANYYFNNYKEAFVFYQAFKERINSKFDINYNDYVCKKIQHVRIPGSFKLYKYNPKECIQFRKDFKTWYKQELTAEILINSLVSNVNTRNTKNKIIKTHSIKEHRKDEEIPIRLSLEFVKNFNDFCVSSEAESSTISCPRNIKRLVKIGDIIRVYHNISYTWYFCRHCQKRHYMGTSSYTEIIDKKLYFHCSCSSKPQYRGMIEFEVK